MKTAILALALVGTVVGRAEAVPVLQLDLTGGTYDPTTQTIVAAGGAFELFAILTPPTGATAADIAALLNTTYYISVALNPPVGPAGANLGSFDFGQSGSVQTYNATGDMIYGDPPIENLVATFDPGDLPTHGIYPTYFMEFAFTFSALNTAVTYNTQNNPGGPTLSPTGGSFFASFLGNSTLLASGYTLHFDLYDEVAARCARNKSCPVDMDINRFAPFSHDAQLTEVPEPSGALFLALGSVLAAAFRFKTRRA